MKTKTLGRHKRDWEELANVDPLWAILSGPEYRGGRWDLDEFFSTGEAEISDALQAAAGLGYPQARRRALDFGCGVGRLTRVLGNHFEESVGVDISEEMIRLARELNAERPNCTFLANSDPNLALLETGTFDFVYSALVLQHMPTRDVVTGYVAEFVRLLGEGGIAVFQTLSYLPSPMRLQPRRRAYSALRRLGLPEQFLLMRLKLMPIRLLAISEAEMREIVTANGGVLELVEPHHSVSEGTRSLRYYVRSA